MNHFGSVRINCSNVSYSSNPGRSTQWRYRWPSILAGKNSSPKQDASAPKNIQVPHRCPTPHLVTGNPPKQPHGANAPPGPIHQWRVPVYAAAESDLCVLHPDGQWCGRDCDGWPIQEHPVLPHGPTKHQEVSSGMYSFFFRVIHCNFFLDDWLIITPISYADWRAVLLDYQQFIVNEC